MTRCFALSIVLAASLAGGAAAQDAQDAPDQVEKPAGHFEQGVFVPEGSTLAEVLEQQAANRAQAEAAQRQEEEDAARLAAYEKAQEAYHAELARIEEEKRAIEAQAAKVAAEHEAAMAKWREDVAACQRGDKSRCAPRTK